MEKQKTKTKILTAITLTILLTLSAILVTLPLAISQTPRSKQTFAIIDFIPNPVGVNQQVLITYGITDFTAKPQMGWEDLTIEITKPDSTTENLGPLMTDTTGLSGTPYVPTMVGTYTLQTHFPQQTVTVEQPGRTQPLGTIMLASSSEIRELTVQEDPIQYYPGHSLPSEYWTRPIDSQLREWNTISGNWLYSTGKTPSGFAPYNDYAPETPHILWAKPLAMGGLAGGELGPHGFECGDAYEGKFEHSVIIGGVLYYNRYAWGFAGMNFQQGVHAVDLRTGEELWFRNNTRLRFGQAFYWDSYNFHGAYPYLWEDEGNTWNAYSAFDGEWLFSYENIPPHNIGDPNRAALGYGDMGVFGPNGEVYRYTVNLEKGWMTLWNSTHVASDEGSWGRFVHLQTTFNATKGIEWNITIPTGLPGITRLVLEDRIIGSNTISSLGLQQPNPVFWAISTAPGQEGQLLWNKTWSLPVDDLHVDFPYGFVPNLEDRVFLVAGKETRQYWGFSIDTGEQIWGPTDMLPPLNAFSIVYSWEGWGHGLSGYGKLVTGGMGGEVNCWNVKTGKHLWTYELDDPYQEILWSNYWPAAGSFITDKKVYIFHTEHSVIDPKPRGAPFVCLDIETGEEIFRVDGLVRTTRWGGTPVIGDSIIAVYDTYDDRIYAMGKGPSATTVTAAPKVVAKGTSILIEGMVTDISSGTKDPAIVARFPNGVPAVTDDDMGEWMLHVYKQFERPNVVGVEVTLDAIGPDGSFISIGTVTSDGAGLFKKMWTPPNEGEYTIIATFEGSGAYWSSYAETALGVSAAEPTPEPTPSPTPTPSPSPSPLPSPGPGEPAAPINMYLIAAAVAVVAVIVAAVIFLRKRK